MVVKFLVLFPTVYCEAMNKRAGISNSHSSNIPGQGGPEVASSTRLSGRIGPYTVVLLRLW
jgi:hypothetical protein